MRIVIIIVSALALSITTLTIVIGSRSFDGTVVDKPYETGLAWDEVQQQKTKLGWAATVEGGSFKTGRNDLKIGFLDKDRKPLRNAVVNVTVSRPSTRKYDRIYQTVPLPDGHYRAMVDFPLKGNWDLMIDVNCGNESTRFKKSIFAEQVRK